MLVKEYRIPFPAKIEDYRIGMIFMIQRGIEEENSKNEAQKCIEVVKQEPYFDHDRGIHGIYTEKVCHVRRFLPNFIKVFLPERGSILIEKSWTAFPHHCLTIYESPFLGDSFHLSVESLYKGNDRGTLENPFDLNDEELMEREMIVLNIADEKQGRMTTETDIRTANLQKFKGQIPDEQGEWIKNDQADVMCSYKLCRLDISTTGLPGKQIERWGHRHGLQFGFLRFNRRLFSLMDSWMGLDSSHLDTRTISDSAKESLDTTENKRGLRPILEATATSIATELSAESSAGLAFTISDETNPFFA